MDYKSVLGILSVVAAIIQYVPYIKDVLDHKTRPHTYTWFVWGLPCGIIFAAQIVKGAGAGSWATAATTILCTIIFVLSLFYGEKNITRLDKISLVMALVALGLWIITRDPLWSVILITAADLLGFVPTVRKSIRNPFEETITTPMVGYIKWLLALPALKVSSLTTYLNPLALTFGNGLFFLMLIYCRRRTIRSD